MTPQSILLAHFGNYIGGLGEVESNTRITFSFLMCMPSMNKVLPILYLSMALFGCNDDEVVPQEEVKIDPAFVPYVNLFLIEANLRGRNQNNFIGIAIDSLTVNLVLKLPLRYCGYGSSFVNPNVQILGSGPCWYSRSNRDKEILIFHELGHAILRRSHANLKLSNGDWKSIMFDGNQFGLYGPDEIEKRAYYLDELFDPVTIEPEWAKE